ncbi:hypothetical protein DAPPUDRAFT_304821 [Daphnia pulex]|uniref:Uncharacterized protein n=1 Tax=Daphnia pulex TaxID=6669 RepID=E9GM34_DAPPU|nr:hypothetical protein DAPPUDRAFT_304821 [Daphnia pulex]|eukprot:EFX79296.1 hypothetical protein DAPPUDRAFT_304821 [Daphnia pulex]
MLSSSGQGNTKDFLVNVKRRPISFIIIYSVCLFLLVFNKSQGKQVGGHHHFSFFSSLSQVNDAKKIKIEMRRRWVHTDSFNHLYYYLPDHSTHTNVCI